MPDGFSAEEVVVGKAPAPKFHACVMPAPVLPVLVKSTVAPMQTGALLVNGAEGEGLMVITFVVVTTHHVGVVIDNFTVFAPGVV